MAERMSIIAFITINLSGLNFPVKTRMFKQYHNANPSLYFIKEINKII
jgi:hypothetical protein